MGSVRVLLDTRTRIGGSSAGNNNICEFLYRVGDTFYRQAIFYDKPDTYYVDMPSDEFYIHCEYYSGSQIKLQNGTSITHGQIFAISGPDVTYYNDATTDIANDIPVSELSRLSVSFDNDTNPRPIGFFDRNGTFISGANVRVPPYTIDVPEKAVFAKVAYNTASASISFRGELREPPFGLKCTNVEAIPDVTPAGFAVEVPLTLPNLTEIIGAGDGSGVFGCGAESRHPYYWEGLGPQHFDLWWHWTTDRDKIPEPETPRGVTAYAVGPVLSEIFNSDKLGLRVMSVDIDTPKLATKYVNVPGRNGDIDLSLFDAGDQRLWLGNRTVSVDFVFVDRDMSKWIEKLSDITHLIHGKHIQLGIGADPGYLWRGWASISSGKKSPIYSDFTLELKAEPYKYSQYDNPVPIQKNQEFVIYGSDIPTTIKFVHSYMNITIELENGRLITINTTDSILSSELPNRGKNVIKIVNNGIAVATEYLWIAYEGRCL